MEYGLGVLQNILTVPILKFLHKIDFKHVLNL